MKKVYLLVSSFILVAMGAFAQSSTIVNGATTTSKGEVKNVNSVASKGTVVNADNSKEKKEGNEANTPISSNANKVHQAELDLPGFPVYVDTGNPSADKVKYKDDVARWKAENPQIWNDYINSKKK